MLRQAESRLIELEKDPETQSFFNAFNLKEKIDQAIRMAYLKDMIYGSYGRAVERVDISDDSLIAASNEHTKMAIAGISLLAAVGALELPGMPVLKKQPFFHLRQITDGQLPVDDLDLIHRESADLRNEISNIVPFVEKMVREARDNMPGLMPIGGKIHTQKPMDGKTLEFMMKVFGLENTSFQLIHAGGSLLIPPMPTALEFNMIVKILEMFGVVDPEFPDIQVAVAGRWNEELAPYVGASVLLGTDRGVLYEEGAFSTTHDSDTGARIMAYDAGVKKEGLPFDVKSAAGRTDMLGRHSLGDSYIYQLLGTLTSHMQFGGIFGNRMAEVNERLNSVFEKYGLRRHLFESAWVYDHKKESDTPKNHERMVRWFTEARMYAGSRHVKDEIQQILSDVRYGLMLEREKVIAENPEEYERLMRY